MADRIDKDNENEDGGDVEPSPLPLGVPRQQAGLAAHLVAEHTECYSEHRTQNTGVLLRILRIGLNQGKEKRLLAKILEKAHKRLSRQNSSATGLSFGALGARTEAKWEQPV